MKIIELLFERYEKKDKVQKVMWWLDNVSEEMSEILKVSASDIHYALFQIINEYSVAVYDFSGTTYIGKLSSKDKKIFIASQEMDKFKAYEILMHELTHAVQHIVSPEIFDNYIIPTVNREKYLSQLCEEQAYRAGRELKRFGKCILELPGLQIIRR